jgi:uncharacterized protein YheU (UPF0270 family)
VTDEEQQLPGIEVPWDRIPAHAKRRLLEEYATRESTGASVDLPLDERVRAVESLLLKRKAVLCFDPVAESFTIVERR